MNEEIPESYSKNHFWFLSQESDSSSSSSSSSSWDWRLRCNSVWLIAAALSICPRICHSGRVYLANYQSQKGYEITVKTAQSQLRPHPPWSTTLPSGMGTGKPLQTSQQKPRCYSGAFLSSVTVSRLRLPHGNCPEPAVPARPGRSAGPADKGFPYLGTLLCDSWRWRGCRVLLSGPDERLQRQLLHLRTRAHRSHCSNCCSDLM